MIQAAHNGVDMGNSGTGKKGSDKGGEYNGPLLYPPRDPTGGYETLQDYTDAWKVPDSFNESVAEVLVHLVQSGERVAVILIDEDKNPERLGGPDNVEKTSEVIEAQKQILQIVKDLNLMLVDVWIDTGAWDEQIEQSEKSSNTAPELKALFPEQVYTIGKPSKNAFQSPKAPNETALGEILASNGIQTALVIGFCGNQCVQSTIFGNHFTLGGEKMFVYGSEGRMIWQIPGLLDRGIRVLTSRSLLVTTGMAPLSAEYQLDKLKRPKKLKKLKTNNSNDDSKDLPSGPPKDEDSDDDRDNSNKHVPQLSRKQLANHNAVSGKHTGSGGYNSSKNKHH